MKKRYMLKSIWSYLFNSSQITPEFEELDISEGNFSIDEVRAIAVQLAKEEQWFLEPKKITLKKNIETSQIFWQITYLMKGVQEEYYTGAIAIINLEDKTGRIVRKSYTPR